MTGIVNEEFKLKNCMEDVVFIFLDEIIKNKDVCKCERCKLDIASIALNNLPTKYAVTQRGEIYAKAEMLSDQFRTNVIVELLKAIEIVSSRPHHC
jgi:competence protein ComFB